jgi:hypothetical protein
LRDHIENVGKQPLEQSGKYRVNGNDEEDFSAGRQKCHPHHYGFRNRAVWASPAASLWLPFNSPSGESPEEHQIAAPILAAKP